MSNKLTGKKHNTKSQTKKTTETHLNNFTLTNITAGPNEVHYLIEII